MATYAAGGAGAASAVTAAAVARAGRHCVGVGKFGEVSRSGFVIWIEGFDACVRYVIAMMEESELSTAETSYLYLWLS